MIPLTDQLSTVERELRLRRRVYPRFIQRNKLTAATAANELRRLEAVVDTLKFLIEHYGPDWSVTSDKPSGSTPAAPRG